MERGDIIKVCHLERGDSTKVWGSGRGLEDKNCYYALWLWFVEKYYEGIERV